MLREILTVAAVMLVMDAIWLTANNATHRTIFAAIQGQPMVVRYVPAAIVYILMIAATWYLAVEPSASPQAAAGRGALLGAAMYGVYDMTNYATLAKYPLSFAVTDMLWGTFLCAVSAATAVAVTKMV
jgi:uncharacterized membrane protein